MGDPSVISTLIFKKAVFMTRSSICLLFSLFSLPLFAQDDSPEKEEEPPPPRWINVQNIGFEILEDKKNITLTLEQANLLFFQRFPSYLPEWQSQLKENLETVPHPQTLPENELFQKMFRATEDPPFAQVLGYSSHEILVKLLQPVGSYRWHHYYKCLASFSIPRNPEMETIFKIADLENTYGREYQGIRQGSRPEEVLKTLGEPTETHLTQAVGFYFWDYEPLNIRIVFQNDSVSSIHEEIQEK
jgi:hypothetical protein